MEGAAAPPAAAEGGTAHARGVEGEREEAPAAAAVPTEAPGDAAAAAPSGGEGKEEGGGGDGGGATTVTGDSTPSGRVIYGKDVAGESDEIQYKWNAIFYNFTPEQKAALALDEVSMYSITDTRSANNTSKILLKLVGEDATVTDGCAAAGGNTLSFAQHFRKVHAVELDDQRFGLLQHNVAALGYEGKVTAHHGDFLKLLPEIKQDVVFLDPPWGGKSYVDNDKVALTFAGLPLAEVCERLKPHCLYIALKLPLNYDFDGLRRAVSSSVVRADDRCARKQLFVILDTSGRDHSYSQGDRDRPRSSYRGGGGGGGGGRGYKRDRDDRDKPWTIKRKT